jgi:hypothetical protein
MRRRCFTTFDECRCDAFGHARRGLADEMAATVPLVNNAG